ncbi:MAG: hypothetical protein Q4D45_12865 [Lachnospiraceae bacterium]|nr:hypothetical protein [Lachnospiraceae bacterium]
MKKRITWILLAEIIFLALAVSLVKINVNKERSLLEGEIDQQYKNKTTILWYMVHENQDADYIKEYFRLENDSSPLYDFGIKLYDESGNVYGDDKSTYITDSSLEEHIIDISKKVKAKTNISRTGGEWPYMTDYEPNDDCKVRGYSFCMRANEEKINQMLFENMESTVVLLVLAQIIFVIVFAVGMERNKQRM